MPTKKTDNVVGYRRESDIAALKEEIMAEVLQEVRRKEPAPPGNPGPAAKAETMTEQTLRARIGRNVRIRREAAGLSQSALARKLPKASPARINNLENGRVGVSLPYLERISEILGVRHRRLVRQVAAPAFPRPLPRVIPGPVQP